MQDARLLFAPVDGVYRRSMRARKLLARTGAALIGLALGTLGLATPLANAAATCSFDEPTAAVQVTLVGGAPGVLSRAADAITLDGSACGTATVGNTDTISVGGTGQGQPDDFTVDLAGGPFAPGLTPETDGGEPEIEITVDLPGGGLVHVEGGPEADRITFGAAGANLNAGEPVGDADLVLVGEGSFTVAGHEGADRLSVAGGDGTGSAIPSIPVNGGPGNDTLAGAAGGSALDGGDGTDTVDYSATGQVILADLSLGIGQPLGGLLDTLSAIENLVGSPGDDVLTGDAGANVLFGGAGSDTLDGHKGDDTLDGGTGRDTAAFGHASKSVSVSLKDGTATGSGADTLTSIENATGSDFADLILGSSGPNVLKGGEGKDEIRGQSGRDEVIGGIGNDLLFGGADRDILDGGRGKDQLDGGEGKDLCDPGPDPDAWTSCEKVNL